MPLTFAETPLYYKDSQGQYHRIMSGADMTGYRTAAAQDAIAAAQNTQIAARAKANEIAVVITGARPALPVSSGQYVIVRNSTISGISDGLYTANTTLSPSTNVTASNLTAVSGGGLNNFASYYDNYNNPTLTTNSDAGITTNSSAVRRKGNLVLLYVNVRNLNGFTAETWTTIHTLNVYPNTTISASCAFQGQTATLRLNADGTVQIYPHGSAFTLFARVVIPFFV